MQCLRPQNLLRNFVTQREIDAARRFDAYRAAVAP
jgi:hypothetical protein